MSLFQERLSELQLWTKKNIKEESKKLKTIKSINRLVNTIDFSSEEIPLRNYAQLKQLLKDIKKAPLSKHEIKLINELLECKPIK